MDDFEKEIAGMFPSKVRKLREELTTKLNRAPKGSVARETLKRRLAVCDRRLFGVSEADLATPAAAPAKPAKSAKEPTPDERIAGVNTAIDMGLVTLAKTQVDALHKLGIILPDPVQAKFKNLLREARGADAPVAR